MENPLIAAETVRKASLSNLHTHEATGSSPVVSTKNHRNRLISVIFFYNSQLFERLNFRRFIKTHTLTQHGERRGKYRTGPDRNFSVWPCFFQRICWLMTPPMASAASCFICAVAWV